MIESISNHLFEFINLYKWAIVIIFGGCAVFTLLDWIIEAWRTKKPMPSPFLFAPTFVVYCLNLLSMRLSSDLYLFFIPLYATIWIFSYRKLKKLKDETSNNDSWICPNCRVVNDPLEMLGSNLTRSAIWKCRKCGQESNVKWRVNFVAQLNKIEGAK
jgi:hypothetical protein